MLKKAHYATFKKEIIIELQKRVEGIFNLELQQFKVKSERTLSDCHALYQEQIQQLKEVCRTKDIMVSKLLETIENLSSNKTTTTAIRLLQTTTAMILKFQDQRIHIWRHHSGTYYQQPLIQQQILIMGDRLMSYQAFQL